MPGDPQKCRERALKCRYFANVARTESSKQMFLALSRAWSRLASELDDANTLLRVLSQIEFEDVSDDTFFEDADQDKAA